MKSARFVLICAMLLCLAPNTPALAQAPIQTAAPDAWDQSGASYGSIADYTRDDWDFADAEFQVPLLGVSVRNAVGKLASGQPLQGLGVIEVRDGGGADVAGMHGEHLALRATLMGAFFAGSMIFPPAMFGAVLVEQSGLGQPRDLIIAVDGTRTHDIVEFQNVLGKAVAGEIVYLTIVRDGMRHQFRVRASRY